MATADPPPSGSGFRISGTVSVWDPRGRELWIGDRRLIVPAGVSMYGVTVGAFVTAIGHQTADGRSVITCLTIR